MECFIPENKTLNVLGFKTLSLGPRLQTQSKASQVMEQKMLIHHHVFGLFKSGRTCSEFLLLKT